MLEDQNRVDNRGNNALHYAYKRVNKEIQDLLVRNKIGDDSLRNKRGFLPVEMNHKKLLQVETDNEPDYLIVLKSKRIEYASFLEQ